MSDCVELRYLGRTYEISTSHIKTTNIALVYGVSFTVVYLPFDWINIAVGGHVFQVG